MSRSAEVTDMVALYIANEGTTDPDNQVRIAEHAIGLARAGDLDALAVYVTQIIKTHPEAREVRDELAANDYDRIDWTAVADELAVE